VWYALVVAKVTVASEPQPQPGQAQQEWFHTYYAWFASTLRQERYYTSAATIGFLSLMVTAAFVRNAFGRRQPFASFGAQIIGAGTLLWVVGAVVSIGGHRAVGLMTVRGDPIETVNSTTWTIDTINDAFELTGSALLGAGMLALARVGMPARSRRPAWSRYTLAVGLVLLATAGAYAGQSFDWSICCSSPEARCCSRCGSSGAAGSCAAKRRRSPNNREAARPDSVLPGEAGSSATGAPVLLGRRG
jgi:hypothetical protein